MQLFNFTEAEGGIGFDLFKFFTTSVNSRAVTSFTRVTRKSVSVNCRKYS